MRLLINHGVHVRLMLYHIASYTEENHNSYSYVYTAHTGIHKAIIIIIVQVRSFL